MANIINPNELFNRVPDEKINFNDFSLSYDNVHTLDPGRIQIASIFKVMPGQELEVSSSDFIRTQPLLSPIFGKLDYFKYAFFVPMRVLSTNWEEYIRAGENGETEDKEILEPDLIKFTYDLKSGFNIPVKPDTNALAQIDELLTGYSYGDIYYGNDPENLKRKGIRPFFAHGGMADMVGIGSVEFNYHDNGKYFYGNDRNPEYFNCPAFSLIPFKAYQACWCEYFADANVHTFDDMDTIQFDWLRPIHTIEADTASSPEVDYYIKGGTFSPEYSDSVVVKNLMRQRYRCYAKDYFTSCLPEPQRGPDVLIPIQGSDVELFNNYDIVGSKEGYSQFYGDSSANKPNGFVGVGSGNLEYGSYDDGQFRGVGNAYVFNADALRGEISALSATIVDLRTACALQEFYESSARYGNRYREFIYGHFASMIPDNQLYRPWYLGGIKMPITIDEVLQTSTDKDSNLGVGNMYGKATTGGAGRLFKRKFDDYGIVIILESIRPRNYYKTYHNRIWSVTDRMDEYWRKLQGVGEQSVTYRELMGNFVNARDPERILDETFGYQMRYSEYKQRIDEIHGDFKGDLSYWTIARDFSNGVELSPEFLEVYPGDIDHIFQYSGTDSDHFLINCSFKVITTLPMDIYSVPRIN